MSCASTTPARTRDSRSSRWSASRARRSRSSSRGAVLYELLTGRPPRSPSTLAELGAPASIEPPDGVPPALARLVMRCLADDPAARPRPAADVAHELAALLPEGETLALPDHPSRRATEILEPAARQ